MKFPFGPTLEGKVTEEFSYERVKGEECNATVCTEICRHLKSNNTPNVLFLPVCIPCYNEDLIELMKVLSSLMQNMEFMLRKAVKHDFNMPQALKDEYFVTVPILVPIFDGIKALSPSMKDFLRNEFPHSLEDMDGESKPGLVDVKIVYSKWWYHCKNAPKDKEFMNFHMVPIIKRSNHRKHNSHEWFFKSICEGLGDKVKYVFLTDCGTTFHLTCVSLLYRELHFYKNLIGVTARQRVETPNKFFHPCKESPVCCCCSRAHKTEKTFKACWLCQISFYFSPCPLQGFEFEATCLISNAMFNIVEALPVMPGPCQLLDWQKMKEFGVVDEYFKFLFISDDADAHDVGDEVPNTVGRMTRVSSNSSAESNEGGGPGDYSFSKMPFTEFLRANMRLAEDRILSFVAVFGTGYGTKWVPGATFYYTPEIKWQSLLTQRRRWLNGTFLSFVYFITSKRAAEFVQSSSMDNSRPGKNTLLLKFFWYLQLFQFLLVLVSPSIFGAATYIGLLRCLKKFPGAYSSATSKIVGDLAFLDLWIILYFLLYATWIMVSYCAPKGKMPESVCKLLAFIGVIYIIPVYFSFIFDVIFITGLEVIAILVLMNMLLPAAIATTQSLTSAVLYLSYLPWFLSLVIFFLVYLPSYSFARLWDTTWGNRAGAADKAINEEIQNGMKRINFIFLCGLIIVNAALALLMIQVVNLGVVYVTSLMLVVFSPAVVQIVSAFAYLFVIVPCRAIYNCFCRDERKEPVTNPFKNLVTKDGTYIGNVESKSDDASITKEGTYIGTMESKSDDASSITHEHEDIELVSRDPQGNIPQAALRFSHKYAGV